MNFDYQRYTKAEWKARYEQYLNSPAWKAKARAIRDRAAECQLWAHHRSQLNVHHRNYDRIGQEREEDLIVLCDPCHRHFHGKYICSQCRRHKDNNRQLVLPIIPEGRNLN